MVDDGWLKSDASTFPLKESCFSEILEGLVTAVIEAS